MNKEQIAEVLEKHALWRDVKPGGERADLRGANLRGADLGGANLRGADLRGADLGGADLGDATLRGANLRGVYLGGADLRGADLRGANLSGAQISWKSHELLGEIIWRAATTESKKMLAAFVGRMLDWCWDEWRSWDHPEKDWALAELAKWIHKDDTEEQVPGIVWVKRVETEPEPEPHKCDVPRSGLKIPMPNVEECAEPTFKFVRPTPIEQRIAALEAKVAELSLGGHD